MRILFVTPRFYPYIGGVESVVENIAKRLVKLGHETIVYTLYSKGLIRKETREGIIVKRFWGFSPWESYHLPNPSIIRKLLKENCDIIHVHGLHSLTAVATYLAKRIHSRLRMIITPYYHGSGHSWHANALWIPYRKIAKEILRKAEVIHTVSRLEAELIRYHFGLEAKVIENGVPEELLKLEWRPKDYRTILYSGRLEPAKNVHILARVVKELSNNYDDDFKLMMIGNGWFKNKLESIINKLNIKYKFYPFLPYKDYIKRLSEATLLALLSKRESYPQSVNEAHAIGTPTITAKPWGLNFADRPRNLIIDINEDYKSIAEKIMTFINIVRDLPRSHVPSWNEVTIRYLRELYQYP